MAIRVRHRAWVQTSRDTDEKKRLFFPDPAEHEIVTDEMQKQANSVLAIDPSGTESLSFGDVTAVRGLYLEVDRACNVRINGSLDDIVLTPLKGASTAAAKLFLEAPITAVTVENLDAVDVLNGVWCVWGDPTP